MSLLPGIADRVALQEILGYLNFSSGASDTAFLRRLNELWQAMDTATVPAEQLRTTAQQLLSQKLNELSATNPAFRDAQQARGALPLIFDLVPAAYREHHRDLLFHQTDASLFGPFFLGRVAEAVLSAGGPWNETDRIVVDALSRLNDFVGYRPVPVLENHKHEPYPHERVRPLPLFIAGAGVVTGKYHALIEQTLAILRGTDRELLAAAWFDPDLMDELAIDPRAYDFNHPANRRPNYHFGGWDPHLIDNQGRYRRFVIQQCTLDAVLARIENTSSIPPKQLLFEAGAVLAGTILMASGTSGSGPETHDSTVSLATLLPHIARYRDEFYQRLVATAPSQHRPKLEAEAASRHQPLAGARQSLNMELARLRALQLQHAQLALLFARLGFADTAMRQAEFVPAASARMVCQMQCLLTAGHRLADAGRLSEGFTALLQCESLLHRAINCGAVVDPWNILGFGGQFSLFPAVENSISDHRVDELLDLVEQIFALYARLWHEAAMAENANLLQSLPKAFRKLSNWWDRFATTSVAGVEHISGGEAMLSAQRVAAALAAWHKAGDAAGTIAFWRPHAEEFDSPQAYGRVIEILLDKSDLQAAMALLMQWLSQVDSVSLQEGHRSFYALAMRWLHTAWQAVQTTDQPQINSTLMLKFFDYLEANADEFWNVPDWETEEFSMRHRPKSRDATTDESDDKLLQKPSDADSSDDDDDVYGAAYESMVYRDSTGDDIDADMLEVPAAGRQSDDELDLQLRRLSPRLAFLALLAALWKMMVLATSAANSHKAATAGRAFHSASLPSEWLTRAAQNRKALMRLAADIQRYPIELPSADYDALIDYDRRRQLRETLLERVAATIVATSETELLLSAINSSPADIPPAESATSAAASVAKTDAPQKETAAIGPQSIAMWSAVLAGDAAAVRRQWATFLVEMAGLPLLYVPLARGGDARRMAQARSLQQMFRELLRRLPRLGLLRETCQLLRVARAMEQKHSPGVGAVTEFDRLFEIAYKSIVESLVESSRVWNAPYKAATAGRAGGKGGKHKAEGGRQKAEGGDQAVDSAVDAQLIECLQQVTESLLSEWLSHSRTLRLSVLERALSPKAWHELVKFIQRYGHDIFTQPFFHLGNLRAILHQGVDVWLTRLTEDDDAEDWLLLKELDHGLSRAEAKKHLSLIVETIVENYAEYRDYNATTTQSDRGEMLYTLLDFLRLKVGYERIHWNLRPVIMAHEVLVQRGCDGAAELWRRAMIERTNDVADKQLQQLAELQSQSGMRLATVSDRLSERFVRPLSVDRVRALVRPAAEEARRDLPPTAFALLAQEAGELAQQPCGAGLDLPDWLEALTDEVGSVAAALRHWDPAAAETVDDLPFVQLTWEEIQSQLTDWDTPPEISK